jgi:hypothetical protein
VNHFKVQLRFTLSGSDAIGTDRDMGDDEWADSDPTVTVPVPTVTP